MQKSCCKRGKSCLLSASLVEVRWKEVTVSVCVSERKDEDEHDVVGLSQFLLLLPVRESVRPRQLQSDDIGDKCARGYAYDRML